MISTEQEQEANEVIEISRKCIETGEGMLKHKTHVFLEGSRICQCKDKDLDRYSKLMKGTTK